LNDAQIAGIKMPHEDIVKTQQKYVSWKTTN